MNTIGLIFVSLLIAAFNFTSYGFVSAEEGREAASNIAGNGITIDIPEKGLTDLMEASIACLLTNRDASRVREGALTGAALLRMGINAPARQWLDVPSEAKGEYVFAVRNYIDYSGDKAYLRAAYPRVVEVLESVRDLRREHEGTGRDYCDDFFALRGFKDGAYLANLMGRNKDADWMRKEADNLRDHIRDSINKNGFDPALTAAAIIESGETQLIPEGLLKDTLDKYFDELKKSIVPEGERALAPYEFYCANAYFITDRRERGLAMLRHFSKNSITTSAACLSYINAVRTIFVYEDDGKLILGEGLAPEWFDRGIEVRDLPTPYGKICYILKKEGDVIKYFVYGSAKPPKGVKFILPKELSYCKIEEMKAR